MHDNEVPENIYLLGELKLTCIARQSVPASIGSFITLSSAIFTQNEAL